MEQFLLKMVVEKKSIEETLKADKEDQRSKCSQAPRQIKCTLQRG